MRNHIISNKPRLFAAISMALLFLGSTGCDHLVKWLPDSSGFIIERGDDLILYKVEKKSQKKLITGIGDIRTGVAITADGNRIAIPRFQKTSQNESLSI